MESQPQNPEFRINPENFRPCEEHSGRVLESRSRGFGFEPHWRHCVVSLSKTLYPLLSTGSTQEDLTDMTEKLLTGT